MVSKRGNQEEEIVGYRFHPTDEELIGYLDRKNAGSDVMTDKAINEVKMCDHEPWELPDKAIQKSEGDHIFHYFSIPDLRFPDSQTSRSRDKKAIIKRSTKSGCWKKTGPDLVIKKNGAKIGIKKAFVFTGKKQQKGEQSNWIMHEYHSAAVSSNEIAYVVCKVKFREGNNASIDSSPWEVAQTSNLVDNAYHETPQSVAAQLPPPANSLVEKGVLGYTDYTRGKSIAGEYNGIRSIDSDSEKARKKNADHETHQPAVNPDQDWLIMMKSEQEDELPAAGTITERLSNEISVSDYGFDYDSTPWKSTAAQYSESVTTNHKTTSNHSGGSGSDLPDQNHGIFNPETEYTNEFAALQQPSSEFQEASLDPCFPYGESGFDFPELPDPNVLNSDFDTLLGGDVGELGSVEASGIDPGLESLGDIGWDSDWFGLFD